MKIIRYDYQHIAIRSNPVGLWIMGLVFVGLAVIAVLFIGDQSTLTCARSAGGQGDCSLAKKTVLKTTTISIPLDQLLEARLATSSDSEGDTYKVVLHTSNGDIPLTSYSSSAYKSHQRTADQINAFISDASQPSLSVKKDSRMLVYILGAVFAGIGLLTLLLTGQITVDLDRSKGLATLKRRSLITSSNEEILLGDLVGADVETSHSHDGNTFRVALLQRSGQRTPLTGYYSSGYKGKQKLAEEINNFLQGRMTTI